MQARVVVSGMQIDNDAVYSGIATQPSPAYSSLYLFDFFLPYNESFRFLNCFAKDFSTIMKARTVIFGI